VNESAVLLVGDLAWPVVVLVIGVIVLITQRAPIGDMIGRLRSFKIPGGEAQLSVVSEVGVAAISTAVESLSRDVTVPQERGKRPVDGQVIEPIQNREPIGDFEPLPSQQVTSLVVLRAQAAYVLEELAFPPPPGGFGAVPDTLAVLRRRGVLDDKQATALGQLIDVADQAARGAIVPAQVALAVQNSGSAILGQLDKLRKVAGPKFEDHVLDVLHEGLPSGWVLDIDRAISRDPAAGPGALVHARVDALVTGRDRSAVVEARARLRPGADAQIEVVREWLAALPPDLPVLLVMLGERLTDRELRWMCSSHQAPVELLLWDRESGQLIMTLRELLDQSEVTTGRPQPRPAG
jgi:hypothetical protein